MDPRIITGSPLLGILALIGSILGGGVLGSMWKTWLDHKRGTRKDTDDVAVTLVRQLSDRIEKLENQQISEREKCDNELRALRHRLNNIDAAFDGVMLAIEAAPDNAKEIVSKAREARARQREREAVESAALLMGSKK